MVELKNAISAELNQLDMTKNKEAYMNRFAGYCSALSLFTNSRTLDLDDAQDVKISNNFQQIKDMPGLMANDMLVLAERIDIICNNLDESNVEKSAKKIVELIAKEVARVPENTIFEV